MILRCACGIFFASSRALRRARALFGSLVIFMVKRCPEYVSLKLIIIHKKSRILSTFLMSVLFWEKFLIFQNLILLHSVSFFG